MKVLVSGKGGCGKSTISAMLGKYLAEKGYRVLIIDADESNPGLYRMLGLPKVKTLAEHLGGKTRAKILMAAEGQGELDEELFNWTLDDIPEEILAKKGNLAVLTIGKIEEAEEGCACPYGFLARKLLEGIKLGENEVIIVDTEAGIEHFGRGVDKYVDVVIDVAEPSVESIELSKKIATLSRSLGLTHVLVLNKALPGVEDKLPVKPDVTIPFDQGFILDSLNGKEVRPVKQIEELWEIIPG
ncbi:ATP-binding protein [Thermococcus gorgonarius]|uniref:Carbon monoxide dehydrogenase n=1 Tax=Thermococcus gorgonarius TaxID=71997 RepID=A0A2Z2M6X9_THEGO|nr:P-loop NTPase [Thermococcus gorgonarius]ASJ01426.1 carbon monoxide dehydrogenase [Thermococcus gorgonarius]